jgi:RNA polymerase sigma-70 factor (ECF subfamily)
MVPYQERSDDELCLLLKAGDDRAFTAIYDRYFWLLHVHAYKWLRNREDAKDIIHELFSTLWSKRETLAPENKLAPYLYASVRNRIFNQLARDKYAVQYVDKLESFLKQGECITDHLVRERMLMEVIERSISEMPRRMRDVFEMSRKQQLSHKEIAEKLDISEETVRKHIHHALKILRPKLEMIIIAWSLMHR